MLATRADDVPAATKLDYKKRRLLQEVTQNVFKIGRGEEFSLTVNKAATDITSEMLTSGSWKDKTFKPLNFEALGTPPVRGHLHPLMKVRAEFRSIFLEMGFTEMPTNNYIESSFWCFDALFVPQQHPARDEQDTFFISDPATSKNYPEWFRDAVCESHSSGSHGSTGYNYTWREEEAQKNVLRTHTTAVSVRMVYELGKLDRVNSNRASISALTACSEMRHWMPLTWPSSVSVREWWPSTGLHSVTRSV